MTPEFARNIGPATRPALGGGRACRVCGAGAPIRAQVARLAPSTGGRGWDDLAQETFLAAWRSASSWRGESSYFTWLARIGWRQFLSHQRSAKQTVVLSDVPEGAIEPQSELKAQLEQAMTRLPPRERMAALLCFAEGHSHSEAALVMSLPLGTLKSLLARARQQLIHCLESDHE